MKLNGRKVLIEAEWEKHPIYPGGFILRKLLILGIVIPRIDGEDYLANIREITVKRKTLPEAIKWVEQQLGARA